MVQLVKNLPAVRETWDQSLGWGDPLEKGKTTHSSRDCIVLGVTKESDVTATKQHLNEYIYVYRNTPNMCMNIHVHMYAYIYKDEYMCR